MTSASQLPNLEIGICCDPKEAGGLPVHAFDYFEVNVQAFLMPEKSDADFAANRSAAAKAARPVKAANCFLPGDLKSVGPGLDVVRLDRYAESAFRRAAEVGIEIIVFGSGGSRTAPEGYGQIKAMDDFVGVLRLFGPVAQRHGVTLVVEPLNKGECNVVNSVAEGANAVERCDHPNVRLLADYYHMLKEGEPASEIVRFGKLIRHTHAAELADRAFPGKSREDFRPFFKALAEIGYTGRLTLECGWDDMKAELEPSVRYLRTQTS